MSESTSGERTFEATERKLQQARERGDVVVVREGPAAGVYLAILLGLLLLAAPIARHVAEIILPMIQQPDAFIDMTEDGWASAAHSVVVALALAILPFFALALAGGLLPYLLQNSIAIAPERIMPDPSRLSPKSGLKRLFGAAALFDFAKNLVKMTTIGVICYIVVRPLYDRSVGYVSTSVEQMPELLAKSVLPVVMVATLVAVVIAGVDMPYQQWVYRRRQRMTLQDMRDELRDSEGNPRIKARRRALRRKRRGRRMMHDVPKATVVITNPTHFAVALRYERGKDAAPTVVAKGVEHVAFRIRKVALEHKVAIVENPPLARALHATTEIGDVIPREHFEAVAKIIGLIWAQQGIIKAARPG